MTDTWDSEKTPILLHPAKRVAMLSQGQTLFNREEFFEAHEIWEQLWLLEQGRDRTFVQGLIQVAAHFVHLRKANWSGAKSMVTLAKEKFLMPPSNKIYGELDITPLLSALNYNLEVLNKNRLGQELGPQKLTALPPPIPDAFIVPKLFEK
ncbi:MAG: DUF309 domain-containing protein [Bdellovibrionota bacterium]